MVSTLGAKVGNHTSYQFCAAYSALGTPRGGRRTVPILKPSSLLLATSQPHHANDHDLSPAFMPLPMRASSAIATDPEPRSDYRSSGRKFLISLENVACAPKSTGLCLTRLLAGYLPRKLSFFQFLEGRIGRGTNPPPQLGQTLPRTTSTQSAQNVHSNEQMRASVEAGGKVLLQCSQLGRSSSTIDLLPEMQLIQLRRPTLHPRATTALLVVTPPQAHRQRIPLLRS